MVSAREVNLDTHLAMYYYFTGCTHSKLHYSVRMLNITISSADLQQSFMPRTC